MDKGETKKLMLFDTILDGHHSDYISHIVEYWLENQLKHELYVVTPKGFATTLPVSECIHFIEIKEDEVTKTTKGTILHRGFAVWNLFLKYAREIGPDHAFLMYLDLFQIGLCFGEKAPCQVSGIFFRPSFHYEQATSLKEKVIGARKKWTLSRILTNGSLEYLFSLDHSCVLPMRSIAKGVEVVPLSDPVKKYTVGRSEVIQLRKSLKIEEGRTVFLVFGFLDDRKGIEQVIDAIALLSPDQAGELALLLVGPIDKEYRRVIEEKIKAYTGNAQLITRFNEIKGSTIQAHFELADFVLTLYQKHIGMSSILVRAALSGRPVLSSDFGYMGKLVKELGLGTTVDSASEVSICGGLVEALEGSIDYSLEKMIDFGLDNSPSAFAGQIVNTLLGLPFLAESSTN